MRVTSLLTLNDSQIEVGGDGNKSLQQQIYKRTLKLFLSLTLTDLLEKLHFYSKQSGETYIN